MKAFSWDVGKALSNNEKHGVSFEGATIFADADGLDWQDLAHSHHETRFKRVGVSISGRVLLVVYARRSTHAQETIRIISARQASRKERQAYARFTD